jgi:signal transduction histidine kinase
VETIEAVSQSLDSKPAPALIKEIDEFNFVFKRIQESQKQEAENQKLLALREKESALIELSQKVAHDIRSPLSAVSLVTTTLQDDDKKLILKNAIQRMNEICSTLLAERKQSQGSKSTPLSSAIQGVIEEKKISLKCPVDIQFTSSDETMEISDSEFKDVISNLLQNSIEAISKNDGSIKITAEQLDQKIKVHIDDNGQGIPHQIISQLGKSPLTYGKGANGNGLGVFYAKKWASKHGGDLEISSNPGQGTKVTLSFDSP